MIVVLLASATLVAQSRDPSSPGPGGRQASGIVNPPLSPRNASYAIDARLDPAARSITGSETIIWRNVTTKPAAELQFHLYWNAWKNTRSTFLREAALTAPIDRPEQDFARLEVTSIKRLPASSGSGPATPLDLTSAKRFIAPDDGNADDETVMAVPLPEPHRRHRELLLHRAVVPQAGRLRGTGLELPPVPFEHRVFLRLRRVRRASHGARQLACRRNGC